MPSGCPTMNDTDRSSAYRPYLQELAPLRDLPDAPAGFIAGASLLKCAGRGQILCEKGDRPAGIYSLRRLRARRGLAQ
jgi:hypothetical protein